MELPVASTLTRAVVAVDVKLHSLPFASTLFQLLRFTTSYFHLLPVHIRFHPCTPIYFFGVCFPVHIVDLRYICDLI